MVHPLELILEQVLDDVGTPEELMALPDDQTAPAWNAHIAMIKDRHWTKSNLACMAYWRGKNFPYTMPGTA